MSRDRSKPEWPPVWAVLGRPEAEAARVAKSPRIQEDQGSRKRSACDGDKFLPTRRCCTILHQQLAAKTEECRQLMNKLAAMEEANTKILSCQMQMQENFVKAMH